MSNGQFSLLLTFRPTIPNSWTKSVELLTNGQKERNHKLYNMKPQVLPGKSAHTRVRGGLRPKLCHGQPLMGLVSFIYLWLHISGYKQMADLNEQERCAPYLDEPRQEEEREGFVHHVYHIFWTSVQGRFYVANEYPTFVRTILIVCQDLKTLCEITLNSTQNLSVLLKNMQPLD